MSLLGGQGPSSKPPSKHLIHPSTHGLHHLQLPCKMTARASCSNQQPVHPPPATPATPANVVTALSMACRTPTSTSPYMMGPADSGCPGQVIVVTLLSVIARVAYIPTHVYFHPTQHGSPPCILNDRPKHCRIHLSQHQPSFFSAGQRLCLEPSRCMRRHHPAPTKATAHSATTILPPSYQLTGAPITHLSIPAMHTLSDCGKIAGMLLQTTPTTTSTTTMIACRPAPGVRSKAWLSTPGPRRWTRCDAGIA